MRLPRFKLTMIFVLGISTLTAGCTFKVGELGTNTQFAYPNSNIEPVGHVSAEVSRWSVLSAVPVDEAMLDEVFSAAAKQKGGDPRFIVDYKLTTTTSGLPPFYYNTTLRLSGTAVKMKAGKDFGIK
jgi:hypothetical protein